MKENIEINVTQEIIDELDKMKINPKESHNEVLNRLIKRYKKGMENE